MHPADRVDATAASRRCPRPPSGSFPVKTPSPRSPCGLRRARDSATGASIRANRERDHQQRDVHRLRPFPARPVAARGSVTAAFVLTLAAQQLAERSQPLTAPPEPPRTSIGRPRNAAGSPGTCRLGCGGASAPATALAGQLGISVELGAPKPGRERRHGANSPRDPTAPSKRRGAREQDGLACGRRCGARLPEARRRGPLPPWQASGPAGR